MVDEVSGFRDLARSEPSLKYLVVCGIVLTLAILGPQQGLESPFDSLWALGALAIMSFVCHQIAAFLRLPQLVGWMAAGLIMGTSGLRIVLPAEHVLVDFLFALATVWVGFQVGSGLAWARAMRWPVSAFAGLSTLAIFALAAGGTIAIAQLPAWLALLLGAMASLWGPVVVSALSPEQSTRLLSLVGSGFSLGILSVVLFALHLQGILPVEAPIAAAKIWLALLAGAAGMEALRRLGLFSAKTSTLLAGLWGSIVLAALVVNFLGLYALPLGLGAGLALSCHEPRTRSVRSIFYPMDPLAFMVFFSLLGAALDLSLIWPLASGLFQAILVVVLAPLAVRGLGMLTMQSRFLAPLNMGKHGGWLLFTKGALLFELILSPRGKSLVEAIPESWARLFLQVVMVDLLVHILVFSTLALVILRLMQLPAQSTASSQEEVPGQ